MNLYESWSALGSGNPDSGLWQMAELLPGGDAVAFAVHLQSGPSAFPWMWGCRDRSQRCDFAKGNHAVAQSIHERLRKLFARESFRKRVESLQTLSKSVVMQCTEAKMQAAKVLRRELAKAEPIRTFSIDRF